MKVKAVIFAFWHKLDRPFFKEFSQHKQMFNSSVKAGKPSAWTFPTGLF